MPDEEEEASVQNPGTAEERRNVIVLQELNDPAKVMDQIRKWNCHFDGKDVYSFLESVDELRKVYGFTEEQTLKGLPELLRGEALFWYRNEARNIPSWTEFEKALKDFFLSPDETRNLNAQIRERTQKKYEPFRTYVTALSTLMRRHGKLDQEEQLDNLYYNMRPELRLYIPRNEVHSASELIQRAEQIIEIQKK